MIDIYIFYNIYGDAQDLISTLPNNVTAVPFGWTEEAETYRNTLLAELGTSISGLPCVLAWDSRASYTTKLRDSMGVLQDIIIPVVPHWEPILVGNWPKEDWTWEKINQEIAKFS